MYLRMAQDISHSIFYLRLVFKDQSTFLEKLYLVGFQTSEDQEDGDELISFFSFVEVLFFINPFLLFSWADPYWAMTKDILFYSYLASAYVNPPKTFPTLGFYYQIVQIITIDFTSSILLNFHSKVPFQIHISMGPTLFFSQNNFSSDQINNH